MLEPDSGREIDINGPYYARSRYIINEELNFHRTAGGVSDFLLRSIECSLERGPWYITPIYALRRSRGNGRRDENPGPQSLRDR